MIKSPIIIIDEIRYTEKMYVCSCCSAFISNKLDPRHINHKMSCYAGPRFNSAFEKAIHNKITLKVIEPVFICDCCEGDGIKSHFCPYKSKELVNYDCNCCDNCTYKCIQKI